MQTAVLFEKGLGVKQDMAAAAAYYQKAADQGSPAGMSGMGILLRFGRGVKKDTAAAARLDSALVVCFLLPVSLFINFHLPGSLLPLPKKAMRLVK